MAELKGTQVASLIVPFTDEDAFATHDAKYGKGGWREVADITERDAITDDRLTIGMAVYVLSENKLYIYKGKEIDPETQVERKVWEEFTSGITGVAWGDITGTLANQTDLNDELTGLSDRIGDTEEDISDIQKTIDDYGDIVTHNASEFQPAGDYATTGELNDLADIVDQEIQDRQDADDSLQEQIDNLSEALDDKVNVSDLGNGTLTIKQDGKSIGVFSANQKEDVEVNIEPLKEIDGGFASAVYLSDQVIDGGNVNGN